MAITGFPFLSNNLLSALSETLLNSIWQGLALAAAAALILITTRRSTPAFRYNLLLGALMAFTCISAYTFVNALEPGSSETVMAVHTIQPAAPQEANGTTAIEPVNLAYSSWRNGILPFIQSHSRQIVTIWLVIVFIRCLQLLTGIQGLYDLRRRQVFDVSAYWTDRVTRISDRMGINRAVQLAESGIAKVPVMIGYLKPIILLPLGMLTALTTAEIEAILIHELAHIRRKDYLVNFLQHLLEIVFFFNPAVLWVSAQIRKERENCCDDIVLAQTGNHISYIRALVACQEYQAQPELAMAIQGQKGSLLGRVNRMLSGKNATLNLAERYVLAICLMLSCLFLAGFSNPQTVKTATQKAADLVQVPEQEAPPRPPVPQSKAAGRKVIAAQNPKPDTSRQTKKQTKTAEVRTTLNTQTTVHTNVNTNVNRLDTLSSRQATKRNTGSINKLAPLATPVPPVPATKPSRLGAVAEGSAPVQPRQGTLSDRVIADLVRDRLISSASSKFSFKLSNTSFEVNGKTQPDAIFERYRRKYVPKTEAGTQWSLYHNYNQNSNTTTTSVEKP
jgi:beta-lactamase regulating signal transducer with metallopeptidase domain